LYLKGLDKYSATGASYREVIQPFVDLLNSIKIILYLGKADSGL
jgi:hypothetical protein